MLAATTPAPLVSILMPVRQWRPTTLAAVESVLAQTCTDFELLIIGQDDVDALMSRLPRDSRMRGLARKRPGIVAALEQGLDVARGQFIARMDDDDVAHATRLEMQLGHQTRNPDIGLVGARVRMVDADGRRDGIGDGYRRYERWLNALTTPAAIRDACFVECPLPHPTWLAHRGVWSRLGGYRDIDGPEDHDLILRARNAGIRMSKPDPVLLDWREHPERLTHQDVRYRREGFTSVRADAAVDPASGFGIDAGRPVWICGTGRNARNWFDALHARGATIAGFVDLDRPQVRQHKRHCPVITYTTLWDCRRDALIVTAITNDSARAALVDAFDRHALINGQDYLLGG